MTKATLTALGAALIALGTELQAEDSPTTTEPPAAGTGTGRRGKAPKDPAPPADPANVKTEAELRELVESLVTASGGWAVKVKAELTKLGANKLGELSAENQPAFLAAFAKLKADFDAQSI